MPIMPKAAGAASDFCRFITNAVSSCGQAGENRGCPLVDGITIDPFEHSSVGSEEQRRWRIFNEVVVDVRTIYELDRQRTIGNRFGVPAYYFLMWHRVATLSHPLGNASDIYIR